MKILIISNTFDSITRLRGDLVKLLLSEGAQVLCIAPDDNVVSGEGSKSVVLLGAEIQSINMKAATVSIATDLRTLLQITAIVRKYRPTAILTYTVKPNTLGVLACQCATLGRVPIVCIMNGAGYAFLGTGWRNSILRTIVRNLYRISFCFAKTVFFYNQTDLDLFVESRIVNRKKSRLIAGSGVDTSFYSQQPVPSGQVVFLMVARLIREKGVMEYIEAARQVKRTYPKVVFALLGPEYLAPSAITSSQLQQSQEEGTIEYWGVTDDVRTYLARSSVVVLPSYREGLSRVLLEALAIGRALITTDVPGCREVVKPGVNGYLVPPKDSQALAAACLRMIEQSEVLQAFGDSSREMAVRNYDSKAIAVQLYGELNKRRPKL